VVERACVPPEQNGFVVLCDLPLSPQRILDAIEVARAAQLDRTGMTGGVLSPARGNPRRIGSLSRHDLPGPADARTVQGRPSPP
jgi:hypothetical protein